MCLFQLLPGNRSGHICLFDVMYLFQLLLGNRSGHIRLFDVMYLFQLLLGNRSGHIRLFDVKEMKSFYEATGDPSYPRLVVIILKHSLLHIIRERSHHGVVDKAHCKPGVTGLISGLDETLT